MSKPVNWIVTELINPYGTNKINDVIATAGYGNTTLTIPNNIVLNGRWKIVAEAPNYVDEAKIFNEGDPVWQENNVFQLPEKIKINASIDTANNPNIGTTNAFLFIYYPNGTLWYQEIASVDGSGNVQFSELILGETNTSRGKYSAQIIWNDHDLNMSQVGFSQFNFVVWHQTSLSAIESNFEKIAGEPFVIRINFTDEDLDTFIGFATVFYNTSYGEHGVAVYSGSGIYIIDVDTSFLSVGDYFFSFNTSNSFYENLSISNLIQLTIRKDFIDLEVPRDVLMVEANTYAIFQFNISGEEFGAPISTDNISTDWHLDYEINEHNNGNYTLNVSTFEVTSGSVPETFYINIYANKTFHGSTSDFVVLTVYPIEAVVNINTTFVQVPLNRNFSVKVNYTVEATGDIISGANCSAIWDSSYNIINIGDEFIIKFNASGLTSDSYIVFVILEHKGYETIYKSINVIVLPQSSELLILNEPLDFINGDMVNITCRFHSDGKNIENANLTFIGDLSADLSWNGSVYYYTLNTTEFDFKSYFIQVYAKATNYQSQLKETLFSVTPLVVEIQTISTLVNYIPGEDKNITVSIDDQSHGGIITSLNVSYELGAKSDFLLLLPDGSFALNLSDLNLSPATQTTYQLKITVINPYGDNDEKFITIVVSGSQSGVVPSDDDDDDSKTTTEVDYSLVVIAVIITGLVIAGGFASLTAYKKVIKNRELKKQRLHNKFLDAFNLNNVIVINKKSGLNVYEQFFAGKKLDATLISGFLDAIRAFGIELTSAYEQSQSISLEYKDSKILMSEFKDFRMIFILKDRPSEEFLKSVTALSYDIDREYGELLQKFAGNLTPFAGIKGLIEHHLNTSFISPLKIIDIEKIELSPAERSLVQKAKSIMKQNKLDYFFTTFLMPEQAYDPKRTQLIFQLIEKKVFQPTDISF
ncbi:MAG: hypothetical protein EU540_07555 [Promethearchaeota archaeon]|nr:MAG: hypothetical protein EU540_07555 [Candidatus Lokiarchaeota archaeon]